MAKWTLPTTPRHITSASAQMYLLKRKPTGLCYNVVNSMIVRATSKEEARGLAATKSMDEKPMTWINPKKSSCEIIAVAGSAEVISVNILNG